MSSFASKAEQHAKKAENYPSIFGGLNLTSIRENVGEILKLIGRDGIFREYTLHDANHIDAMLALVDKLIPPDTAAKMRTADWLMIVLSCYFHDLGMLVTKKEFDSRDKCAEFLTFKDRLLEGSKGQDYQESLDKLTSEEREEFLYQEFVRSNHAKRVFHWIQGQDAVQYGIAKSAVDAVNGLLAGLEQVVRDDLAKICLSHHEDDLWDFDKYQINRVYGDDPEGEANLHYAAIILRAADVLQIQKKRVPTVLYQLIDPSNPKSQEEWAKQAGVRAIKPKTLPAGGESDTIEVHASFDNERAYFGLLAYLQQYAAKELDRCHDWTSQANKKGSAFQFPWKQIDSSQVEPRGFEGRSYSFRLDQEKILKLLTGHTLYNDSRVAVREVLQNALDAVRFRKHLFPEEPIGKIEIVWDSKARRLTVRDSGTGMTQDTIEKFLLNVGSSFYQSEAVLKKYESFSAISRFGIGVLSTFMIADEVRILTVHPDDEYARRLTLPSVVKSYLIKKIPKGHPDLEPIGHHGTEVTLQLRRSANLSDVEALVRFWLVIPQCEVVCRTDGAPPVAIGFVSAQDVLDHYYQLAKREGSLKSVSEVRTSSLPGMDLAYVARKSFFADVWDFDVLPETQREEPDGSDDEPNLSVPPGMCVEGFRVRSTPAGYDIRDGAPWVFVNLSGRGAPRTNVARSDIEQTPELDAALFRIYSLLGKHIEREFERLQEKKVGLVEAAWEADYIRASGLEVSQLTSRQKYEEAISGVRVIGLEDGGACRAVTLQELRSLERVWSVDSRLIRNLDGVCGATGLDMPVSEVMARLGGVVRPAMPTPRVLGSSSGPLTVGRDITKIYIYPEERSHRIDICWGREQPGRWVGVPRRLKDRAWYGRAQGEIWITGDPQVSSECPGYDVVYWRDLCLILATSSVHRLLGALGMGPRFLRWLQLLLEGGEIPIEDRTVLREHLVAAKGADGADIMSGLALRLDRRFGGRGGGEGRSEHLFSIA
jgi:hypothetical protein